MTNEEYLKRFYKDYLAWAKAGAPEDEVFDRTYGLCINLEKWQNAFARARSENLLHVLVKKFVAEGLDKRYPFQDVESFYKDSFSETLHLNPTRIKWVEDHA